MSKIRVYELAKQLNLSSKDLMAKLEELQIHVHSHMSTLEDEEKKRIDEYFDCNKKENQAVASEVHVQESEEEGFEDISDQDEKKKKKKKKNKSKQGFEEEIKGREMEMKNTINREEQEDDITVVKIAENTSIKDFSEAINKPSAEIVKKLFLKGMMVNVNSEISFDIAEEIALEYDIIIEKEEEVDFEQVLLEEEPDNEEDLLPRPPVVVVMGHVDHGKTSLLDALRNTAVTSQEAGGITQHIGASTIKIGDKQITFLDTPGHEAFTAMRLRGAQVTDIAILVVAADDGVMPQTIEAINHAKAANVEIIVAINKMDKPSANPDRVKQELTEYALVPEDWGGSTICVGVSALKGEGLDELLEMVLLTAEMKELRANPNKLARGTVIEAQLDKGRGPVATVLVQSGTLHVGDSVVAGTASGRVRAMIDSKGRRVKKAEPSTPVEILGLDEVPVGGDAFLAVENDQFARQIVEKRRNRQKEEMIRSSQGVVTLDNLFAQMQEGQVKELNIVVKADVQGSVEAVKQSLAKLSTPEVRIRIIHGGVGAVNESDVMLASASNAIIIGFNVRPDVSAQSTAERNGVDIRLYRVIYNAIEDIEAAMKGMLDPEFKEVIIGHAEVRQTFKVSGVGTIAGCYVTDGKVRRDAKVRLVRGGIVIYEGELSSLKRFKDDAKEVASGYECGTTLHKFNDLKDGDVIEAFVMEEIPRD